MRNGYYNELERIGESKTGCIIVVTLREDVTRISNPLWPKQLLSSTVLSSLYHKSWVMQTWPRPSVLSMPGSLNNLSNPGLPKNPERSGHRQDKSNILLEGNQ